MTSDPSRRFTDREVALVLRKASELDGAEESERAAGLSLRQLEEIAGEVGIAPELVRRAVADLERGGPRGLLAGGPLTRTALRAVPAEVDRERLARLVRRVEESSDQVGQVTEALGGTQWTARDRFTTTQVSISPADGETRVRVVERMTARYRRLAHLAPAMGVLTLAGLAGSLLDPSDGLIGYVLAGGLVAGGALGRVLWSRISQRSAARVERLAAEVAGEASRGLAETEPAG